MESNSLDIRTPSLRPAGGKIARQAGRNAAPAIPELIGLLGDGHVRETDGLMFQSNCR